MVNPVVITGTCISPMLIVLSNHMAIFECLTRIQQIFSKGIYLVMSGTLFSIGDLGDWLYVLIVKTVCIAMILNLIHGCHTKLDSMAVILIIIIIIMVIFKCYFSGELIVLS